MQRMYFLPIAVLALALTPVKSDAQDNSLVLEEITVTATKREQSTLDVPFSVAAVSGEALVQNSIQDLTDLSTRIPNLIVTNSGSNKNITIRGMGSPAGQRGNEQAVAMYIDGVYKPRSKQYYSPFLDIERVEVLRGPQAVLFGVNATAGAINIVSATNNGGDEFEGTIRLENEFEYGGLTATGILGGGLSDNFGARLVVKHQDTDGFFVTEGPYRGDTEATTGRLSLVFEPSDSVTISAKVDAFDGKWNGISGEGLDPLVEKPDNVFTGIGETPFGNRAGVGTGYDRDGMNAVANLDWDIGSHTLTAIASVSDFEMTTLTDFDGATGVGGVDVLTFESMNNENFEQSTLELRLASPGGEKVDYIIGLYAQDSDMVDLSGATVVSPIFNNLFYGTPADPSTGLVNVFAGTILHTLDANDPHNNPFGMAKLDVDQKLYSVFANVTINVSDAFSLTLGARYNDEDKKFERSVVCGLADDGIKGLQPESSGSVPCIAARLTDILAAGGGPGGAFFTRADGVGADSNNWQHFLPEVSFMWDMSENHRLFGRVAKGAKSGGMTSSWASPLVDTLFEDETVTAIELGTKSSLMDGRAELNATIFSNDYKDLQVTSFSFGAAKVDNAGRATVQGLELDGRIAATDWLTLGASLSFLDTNYDEYTNGTCADAPSPSTPNPDGISCNMTGLPLVNAPEFSSNWFADIETAMTSSINFVAGANISTSDDYFTEAKYINALKVDAYTMVDAYVGLKDADGRWSVSLVGRNLSNEILTGSGVEINALGLASVVPTGNYPRMYFLNAQLSF